MFDAALWRRVEPVLDAVLDAPAAERDTILNDSCAGDLVLRAEVERLLTADLRATEFLSEPFHWRGIGLEGPADRPGRIGPFRILDEVGRGGMGVVFLAERVDGQFEQRVALKCIGRWTGVPDAEARFLRERRILAQLEHAHIARLLDGGLTDDDRPYYAMEYIDGEPITEHCEKQALDLGRRLGLFQDVCRAVEYAHQRLIVHCDLKPSNILVTATGQVKLLDFGLAKLFDLDQDDGLATATQHRLLTPVYAAPEQLEGQTATTATDVYALGVVLYELVAGRRPFEIEGRGVAEYQRDVLEREPSRPSPERSSSAADIDAICLKALRKEPEQRYPSVDALRRDLERFRAGLPVEARQGTTGYRFRKFLQRNKVETIAATVVLGAILVGAGVAFYQAKVASAERRRAEFINEFFVGEMIGAASPEASRGRQVSVEDVLDTAARRLETSFSGEPELEAAIRQTLGRSYASLGRDARAEVQLAASVSLFTRATGSRSARTLAARAELEALRGRAGDYDGPVTELNAIHQSQVDLLGAEHPDPLRSARLLAEVEILAGAYLEGQRRLETVIEVLEKRHPDSVRERLAATGGLCNALKVQRKNDAAERICRETLDLQREALGSDHPDTLRSETQLAGVLKQLDRFDESIALLEPSVVLHERVFGEHHESTIDVWNWLAGTYWRMGRVSDAHRAWSETLERAELSLGPDHPLTISLTRNVAMASRAMDDWDGAERMYKLALQRSRATLGASHPRALKLAKQLGELLFVMGKRDEAVALWREEIELADQVAARPDAEPTVLNDHAWFLLVCSAEELQDPPRALALALRAVELTHREHPGFLDTLANAYHRTGDVETAIEIQREALRWPDSLHRYDIELSMVTFLNDAGRPDEVENFLLSHLERRRAGRPEGDPTIGETLRRLGRHAIAQRRFDEGLDWLDQARDHFRAGLGEGHWRECRVLGDKGDALLAQQRPDEAEALYRKAVDCAEPYSVKENDVYAALLARLASLKR